MPPTPGAKPVISSIIIFQYSLPLHFATVAISVFVHLVSFIH